MCVDLIRRGVERVSLIVSGYEGEMEHDWEQCQWCELNRDLFMTAQTAEDKCNQILNIMWYAFINEPCSKFSTPISSNASSPRVMESTVQKKFNQHISEGSSKPTQSLRNSEVDTTAYTVQDSVKLMWTQSILDAENWFQERRNYDGRCALHWAEAAFLGALLTGDKDSRKLAYQRLEFAEKIADEAFHSQEKFIGKFRESRNQKLKPQELHGMLKQSQTARIIVSTQAEIFLFKAGNEILNMDYFKCSIHFRNAWKQHLLCEELTQIHNSLLKKLEASLSAGLSKPLEMDIENLQHFQKGIFLLSLSMAPSNIVRLAKYAGLEANQKLGLKELYKCINSKVGVRVPLAIMFVLFWLLVYIPEFVPGKEGRYKEAKQLIKFANHYYPNSIYFNWLQSYMCAKQGELVKALRVLDKAISNSSTQEVPHPRLLFEKGWLLFLCQEWEEALNCLVLTSENSTPTPFTQLLVGTCSCMIGQLDQAEQTFSALANASMEKSSIERWITRRTKRYLNRRWFQLFPYEIIYATDYLHNMKAEWLENSLNFLKQIGMPEDFREKFEVEEVMILLLIEGTVLRNLGRLSEAVKVLEKVVKHQNWVNEEKWVVPHALYELGLVYTKGRDWKAANRQFSKAKLFKKYDFRRNLNFKLNSAIEYVSQEESKEKFK